MTRLTSCIFFLILAFSFRSYTEERNTTPSLTTLEELEDRLAKGGDTTFVVNFWATWCVPCVKEMPYFEQVSNQDRNKPLKLLFVSLDSFKKPELVSKFVEDKGIKNEVLILKETDQQYYIDRISPEWSGAIPATLMVKSSTNKRVFYEREFTLEALKDAVNDFEKDNNNE